MAGIVETNLQQVERGERHGTAGPGARLEHRRDALAAVAGHNLAIKHG